MTQPREARIGVGDDSKVDNRREFDGSKIGGSGIDDNEDGNDEVGKKG